MNRLGCILEYPGVNRGERIVAVTVVKRLESQLLAPQERKSAILEVCDHTGLDFLHVAAVSSDE